jgi:hypothetical protein
MFKIRVLRRILEPEREEDIYLFIYLFIYLYFI